MEMRHQATSMPQAVTHNSRRRRRRNRCSARSHRSNSARGYGKRTALWSPRGVGRQA
ncbi:MULTISPECIES: hypothetical protein [unclassified Streptomyces]|uniref:hypothetical protein n=1 Tax=unclassified Streptomyces TaxID=2593676 RepID=UPI00342313D7